MGSVLMQDGHPVAFEIQKLNDTEKHYTLQEKEMTVVVHCILTWRHNLLGSEFVIKTENITTTYFQSQKKLNSKQAQWQDLIVEFDYIMEYKLGYANLVADALSQNGELADFSRPQRNFWDLIKEGLQCDLLAQTIIQLMKEGKTWRFWEEDGLALIKGKCICVPSYDNFRREVMKECYDVKWVGHLGMHCTLAPVGDSYYWPHLNDGVEAYMKTCLMCQQDKIKQKAPCKTIIAFPHSRKVLGECFHDFHSGLIYK